MIYRLLTDLTVVVHFLFLLFVVGGAFLVRRYRWLLLPHLCAVVWGVYVEAAPGIICPLTPVENRFAALAGDAGYTGSFVEHYLVPIIYPDGLTREAQWALAALVLAVNVVGYATLWWGLRTRSDQAGSRTAPSTRRSVRSNVPSGK